MFFTRKEYPYSNYSCTIRGQGAETREKTGRGVRKAEKRGGKRWDSLGGRKREK